MNTLYFYGGPADGERHAVDPLMMTVALRGSLYEKRRLVYERGPDGKPTVYCDIFKHESLVDDAIKHLEVYEDAVRKVDA